MIGNPLRQVDAATYAECVTLVARDLGTSMPNIQVLKLMAWLFDMPIGTIRADCQEAWSKARQNDIQQGR